MLLCLFCLVLGLSHVEASFTFYPYADWYYKHQYYVSNIAPSINCIYNNHDHSLCLSLRSCNIIFPNSFQDIDSCRKSNKIGAKEESPFGERCRFSGTKTDVFKQHSYYNNVPRWQDFFVAEHGYMSDIKHYQSINDKWKISAHGNIVTLSKYPFDGAYHMQCYWSTTNELRQLMSYREKPEICITYIAIGSSVLITSIFIGYILAQLIRFCCYLIELLKRNLPESGHNTMCTICWTNPRDLVYLPCRHYITCSSCGQTQTVCPICKQPIDDILTIYNS